MFELTGINNTFQKARNAFSPIGPKPNDGDLQRLNEVLVICCPSVTFTRTAAGSPSGIFLPEYVYKENHRGASFNFMRAACAYYNPSIQNLTKDNRMLMMRGLEHSWAAGMANQSRIRAIELGGAQPHTGQR